MMSQCQDKTIKFQDSQEDIRIHQQFDSKRMPCDDFGKLDIGVFKVPIRTHSSSVCSIPLQRCIKKIKKFGCHTYTNRYNQNKPRSYTVFSIILNS